MKKQAILVVSYGTSHKEAWEKSISAIEKRIQEEFQEYEIYRALTGKRVIKKLSQSGVHVNTLTETLEIIKDDDIEELIVQPVYVTQGTENANLEEKVKAFSGDFQRIVVSRPLLSSEKDCRQLADIIIRACQIQENEGLILVGHGTLDNSNFIYLKLEEVFKNMGHKNILVAVMKGNPSFQEAEKKLETMKIKKVILQPFMITAGEHVKKDMAGEENSWKSELEQKGYQVECNIKGLGEFAEVQEQFIRYIKDVLI